MKANDKQVAGDHYKSAIEPWDAIEAWGLGYLDGSAVKYLARWRKKNGVEDVMKAIHFLEKLVERENARLQRTQITDQKARQEDAQTTLRSFVRGGSKDSGADSGRNETTSEFNKGTYQPKSLREIL